MNLTRFSPVTLIGTTNPNQQVLLDLDGDGFDDGSVQAERAGGPSASEASCWSRDRTRSARRPPIRPARPPPSARSPLDQVAPRVIGYRINQGEAQRSKVTSLEIQFSKDVSASVTADDLLLNNLTKTANIEAAALTLTFTGSNSLLVTFPTLTGGSLPDGNYLATVLAAGITDLAGNVLAADGNGQPWRQLPVRVLPLLRRHGWRSGRGLPKTTTGSSAPAARPQPIPSTSPPSTTTVTDDVDETDLDVYRGHYMTVLSAP